VDVFYELGLGLNVFPLALSRLQEDEVDDITIGIG